MNYVRKAKIKDLERIAEIIVFNYRLNFYPIFQNDDFYFDELKVSTQAASFLKDLEHIWVYDDGVVKGFIQVDNQEVIKLFVEPILQGKSIGTELLNFAIREMDAKFLWALEKNSKAIAFYKRNGFYLTNDKKIEEDTTEYLVRLER